MITPRRTFIAFLSIASLATAALSSAYGAGAGEYDWTQFAGQVSGLGHADATGTNSQFLNPAGVAADGAGNVYVADTANHVIREITSNGVVSTIAGTPGVTGTLDGFGSAAEFNAPAGIAVSSQGVIYVADTGNDTIRRINPSTDEVTTIAGDPRVSGTDNGLGSTAQFNAPGALAVDGDGNVFVADTLNDTIRKVTYLGDVTTLAGLPRTTGTANGIGSSARFDHPAGIAYDLKVGRFLIADTDNDTVRELRYNGSVTTFAGTPRVAGVLGGKEGTGYLDKPVGIAVANTDRIYVANSGADTISRIDRTGNIETATYGGRAFHKGSVDGEGPNARFDDPMGVAAGVNGVIFVADTGNSTIREITAGAIVTTFAGSPTVPGSANGQGTAASFDYPTAATVSVSGTIYIADTYNDIIRAVSREGLVSTYAGTPHLSGTASGAGSLVRFSHPSGVVSDTNGNVYVADTDNDTIRMITPAGLVSTFAGTPRVTGTSDGTGSSALFNHPHGLAIDALGNIYVADTGNDTIREISAGTVATVAGTPNVTGTANGTGSAALFNAPEGIVADGTNGVFIADTQNQTIRRMLPNYAVSTYAGDPGHRGSKDGVAKVARFDSPSGIAADNHHRIFVADTVNDTIREIEPDLKATSTVTTIGGSPKVLGSALGTGSNANFGEPRGIAATQEDGVLFVADSLNNRIVKGMTGGGALKVKLTPAAAVGDGAEWSVDGSAYYASGTVLRNLTPGTHTLSFKSTSYFVAPSSRVVNISAFQTTVAVGDYLQEYGAASATILPQAAINENAGWKIDGSTVLSSGETDYGLPAGSHTIYYTTIPGYDRPANQTVIVPANGTVTTTGTYTLRTGSLTVDLIPFGAVDNGAQWNVDGGAEQNSGATVTGLTIGQHTVNFEATSGYATPDPQSVNIFDQQTTTTTGTYAGIPVLTLEQPVGTALVNNTSTVNFGPVVSGSTLTLQFAIANNGTTTLNDLALAITGSNASRFSASALATNTLAVGGTTTFTVSCNPVSLAALSGTLTVTSNDPVNSPFSVALAASGTNGPINFKGGAGSYVGLLSGTNNTVRGIAVLTLSTKGALTGKFLLDGVLSTVRGTFATNGKYTGTPSNVSMLLTGGSGGPLSPAGYQIFSNATVTSGSIPYVAYHAAYTATQIVSESRKYTILMSGTNPATTVPQGTSYATLSIAARGGAAKLTGKLADGTPFTYATFVASGPYGHQILVFDSALYRSKGFLAGPLNFANLTDTNVTGIFQWVNPGSQSKVLYPLGFNTLLYASGAVYLPPVRANQPIPLTSGTFTLSDGGLPSPFSVGIFLTTYPAEKVLLTGVGNPYDFKATVNGVAGSFSGSFVHPISKKTVVFSGLLYQNTNDAGAAGLFVGPILEGAGVGTATTGTALSGNVVLVPSGP